MIPDDPERLRELLAHGDPAGPCPSPELLARVATTEATSPERNEVVDHLATCAACSEEYRVAVAVAEWGQQAARGLGMPSSDSPRRPALSLGYAVAAMLVAAVSVGLIAWALVLREENARLHASLQEANRVAESPTPQSANVADLQAKLDQALAPALNVPIIDLLPAEGMRGSAPRSSARISSTARLVTFVITTASNPGAADHELELVDPSGVIRWRSAGLRPNSDRVFTITVPRSLFAVGTSRFRLYAAGKLAGEYSVWVDP